MHRVLLWILRGWRQDDLAVDIPSENLLKCMFGIDHSAFCSRNCFEQLDTISYFLLSIDPYFFDSCRAILELA